MNNNVAEHWENYTLQIKIIIVQFCVQKMMFFPKHKSIT